jgi:hypothetical protein
VQRDFTTPSMMTVPSLSYYGMSDGHLPTTKVVF